MAERGITEEMIREALQRGKRYWDPKNRVVNFVLVGAFDDGQPLLVGQNPVTGTITTAIKGHRVLRPGHIAME